ncbi:MAG: hypothetical protein AseanaTS_26620 [Candidatus Pelagadaptatus aseana]|uniref:hypothetical protein n=1 Tax=Candidatus Pelagadaptatus aseana TaxID=3120508 RepID=UPI0039B2FA14
MMPDTETQQLLEIFKLPPQDRRTLGFCQDHRPAAVAAWAEALPATRISNTSVLLYKALPEVVRIETTPANRLAMLESLRPYVQRCIQGLARNFLNQPLILPEGAMKTAVIAQALQKHMSNGYLVVLKDLLHKRSDKKISSQEQHELGLVLHRSITGLGLQFLRSAQLYTPAPPQLWRELNGLYVMAERLDLLHQSHPDQLLKHQPANTIEQSYIRTLMLACASPNQMRQNDVLALYDALESWSLRLHLKEAGSNQNNLFVVDLDSNHGPIYKTRYEGGYGARVRDLDFSPILFALEKLDSGHVEEGFVPIVGPLASLIYTHVRESWGVARSRHSKRLSSHTRLDVVVGLSAIHFHACEGLDFNEFLAGGSDSSLSMLTTRFEVGKTEEELDPWNDAPDASGGFNREVSLNYTNVLAEEDEEQAQEAAKYPVYQTVTLDASADGYCLDWREKIPANAKVGELLGIREPGRSVWAVGVVRWVRQSKGASQLGVQMLSPSVKPCAAQQIQKSGENADFMRALLVPEFKASKTPASLITPVLPFRVGDKTNLNQKGQRSVVQLSKERFSTSSVKQFGFRVLDAGLQENPEQSGDILDDW